MPPAVAVRFEMRRARTTIVRKSSGHFRNLQPVQCRADDHLARAEALMALEALHQSNLWDKYWDNVLWNRN